jgi:CspA family cold shock protein
MDTSSLLRILIVSVIVAFLAVIIHHLIEQRTLDFPSNLHDLSVMLQFAVAVIAGNLLITHTENLFASKGSPEMGTVKWFNVKKGYGFITRDQGDDVFVHFRNIRGSGRRSISDGQRVEFVVISGKKGLQADDVHPI